MRFILCALFACVGSLTAEVVSVDGEEHLILPAELVVGDGNRFHRDLRHAKPYALNDAGELHLTDVYTRIYKFDAEAKEFINKRLLQLQRQYTDYIYKNGKFTIENGDNIVVYEGMSGHMDPIIDRFVLEVDGALTEKQQRIVKYFDLYEFENFGQLMRFDEGEVKVILEEPREEREIADPEVKKAIEELRAQVDEAKKKLNQNRGANSHAYYKLKKELKKVEAPCVARSNYTIKILVDDATKTQRGSNKKQGMYLLFEKAFELHLMDQSIK